MVEEARLGDHEGGQLAETDGWFVGNVRDSQWLVSDDFADACPMFEGAPAPFPQVGYTIAVLKPGLTGGLYHRESAQEDFLVLAGECIALVEGEERRLRAWDFLHCPPGTDHVLIGAGDGPCIVFMTGARPDPHEVVYVRSELALEHRAGVETETTVSAEAYAPFERWHPGRPAFWDQLPWA